MEFSITSINEPAILGIPIYGNLQMLKDLMTKWPEMIEQQHLTKIYE